MQNNEGLSKSVICCVVASVALALTNIARSQQASPSVIVDQNAPKQSVVGAPRPQKKTIPLEELPPWRDLRPREWTSMLTAISFATELIPYLDERDKSTLTAATGRLSGLNVRAAQHVDQVCSDLLFGNIAEQGRAEQVAALLTGGDEIQEEDARLFFEGVLDSLSEEGRTAVIGLENDIAKNNKTANWMDWLKFAELAPEEMLETATRNCESRLGVSRRQ